MHHVTSAGAEAVARNAEHEDEGRKVMRFRWSCIIRYSSRRHFNARAARFYIKRAILRDA